MGCRALLAAADHPSPESPVKLFFLPLPHVFITLSPKKAGRKKTVAAFSCWLYKLQSISAQQCSQEKRQKTKKGRNSSGECTKPEIFITSPHYTKNIHQTFENTHTTLHSSSTLRRLHFENTSSQKSKQLPMNSPMSSLQKNLHPLLLSISYSTKTHIANILSLFDFSTVDTSYSCKCF